MKTSKLYEILINFIPPKAAELIVPILCEEKIILNITKPRSSKLGDYRAPYLNQKHKITINKDLNKFQFLITLLHEIAHLYCYNKYKDTVAPHGNEWKSIFKNLSLPFLTKDIFPEDIIFALQNHFKNTKATSCSDPFLQKILLKYDLQNDNKNLVESFALGTYFKLDNGMIFKKGKKIRTRYQCTELKTNKIYLVQAQAIAKQIHIND